MDIGPLFTTNFGCYFEFGIFQNFIFYYCFSFMGTLEQPQIYVPFKEFIILATIKSL
jgi:hypothetical protein